MLVAERRCKEIRKLKRLRDGITVEVLTHELHFSHLQVVRAEFPGKINSRAEHTEGVFPRGVQVAMESRNGMCVGCCVDDGDYGCVNDTTSVDSSTPFTSTSRPPS
ncbi:unnamed protein product [Heligmosomoides polygyrus]|uniref:RNase H domain-containing protein n=1 Tax=Heligmosomoides polygyrus TaxID=6339 RepID=A0A183FYS2_HELPZ|nr:unnamed protein product [Heligmosomoides polygyrus]